VVPNNSEKIIGHHAKIFRGACQRSFLECREEIQMQSSKMLTIMFNSLELMNNYITKSNSCKMREREREREIVCVQ
jgi:hypothetical protein